MVESAFFIGAVIAGVTQFIKLLVPRVNGAWVIATAVAVGVVIALIDTNIGVADISVAAAVLTALAASGVIAGAEKIG